MKSDRIYPFFFIQFLFLFLCHTVSAQTVTYSAVPSRDDLSEWLPAPVTIYTVTHSADIFFSHQEFEDLTQLHDGMVLTPEIMHHALGYLFFKNKFQTITCTLENNALHIACVALWTFEQLRIHGIWVERDWYKQFYVMEPGDPFDDDKHQHSLQKIKEACLRLGFFNVHVSSSFGYNYAAKSIKVHVTVARGKRFRIGKVTLRLSADKQVSSHEIEKLDRLIYKKYLRPMRTRRYAKEILQEQARIIKKFLAHQGFLFVDIALDERIIKQDELVDVAWDINLHKKRNFIFFGNHFFSHVQLLDQVLQFGKSSWMLPASMLAQELMNAYYHKGFWDTIIDTREEGERSFFVIKEGVRASIHEIQLQGVQSFSEHVLIRRCFASVKRRAYFDQKILDRALDALISFYTSNGFLQAKIMTHEFVPLASPASHTLVVRIDEGRRTMINAVVIDDPFKHFEKKGPFARFHKKRKPIPFDAQLIQEHKQWLVNELQKIGYLFAQVKSELIAQDDGGFLLSWHIVPGEEIIFGKTILHASTDIPYNFLKRELVYQEGAFWNQQAVRDSFLRLKKMNMFDSISLIPLAAGSHVRPVLIKVHEDDPFELRVRGGLEFQHIQQYQTFAGVTYKVGGTFLMKNPTNHADQLTFDVNLAQSHRETIMNYRYPWLFGFPVDGLLQGYSIAYEQPGFIGNNKNIYTIFQNGFLVGLRRKLPWLDAGINLGFEMSRTKISRDDVETQECARMLACAIDFDPRLLNERIPFFFCEPTVIIDLLDNNLNPKWGTFSVCTVKGMFPTNATFRNSFFVKVLCEHSCFASISDLVTFALRFRLGHIFHRQFCDIPPNERFYLGGAHSVRSYQADHAPPLGCFVDCEQKSRTVPRGGKTMLNCNAEIRIPVFAQISAVLFNDVGLLAGDNFSDCSLNHVVGGTGFGVRYFTPIGPLRFDIAWKWKKHVPTESRFNWFLTFGQAF